MAQTNSVQENESGRLSHTFDPVWDENSEILILGSFPSVLSRKNSFYYGHPQNRFWKLLAALFDEPVPADIEEKKAFLLRHHIALWDVIESCEIEGSSDASIRNVKTNDLSQILDHANIQAVFTNGGKASQLYKKHQLPLTGVKDIKLPSTSPANASFSLERLKKEWQPVLQALAAEAKSANV